MAWPVFFSDGTANGCLLQFVIGNGAMSVLVQIASK